MQASKLLAVSALVLWAIQVVEAKTYEEFFTQKAGQAYNEDINVWTYTSQFANRFAMPKEWIDNDLKGAYAIAFRVETASGQIRFPHKGPNISMLNRRCILDVYVDDKAPVPWANDQTADFWFYTPNSPTYLLPQNAEDRAWRSQPVGIPRSGKRSRNGLVHFGTADKHLGGFPIREYDRKIYPDISYISFLFGCTTPPKKSAWIEFSDYNDPYSPTGKYTILHRIEMPEAFMEKLYDLWYVRSRNFPQKALKNIIENN